MTESVEPDRGLVQDGESVHPVQDEELVNPVRPGEPAPPVKSAARRRSRRRTVLALLLALVVLVGAVPAMWATDTGPFTKRSFCWGAWQEDSGPEVLGDLYGRASRESGVPERGERVTCTMVLTLPGRDNLDTADIPVDDAAVASPEGHRVVARVGPPPRATGEGRRAWLAEVLSGGAAPLPEGLPGVVGKNRGTLVLPEQCDSGGLPTVVTVRGSGSVSVPDIGREGEVADLLLSLANTARESAGCAGTEPFRITAPVRGSEEYGEKWNSGDGRMCGIPGMRFGKPRKGTYTVLVGAVEQRLQTCSVQKSAEGVPLIAAHFVMTSQPRLAALVTDMSGDASPGKGWRGKGEIGGGDGLVVAECRGRPTVFSLHLDDRLDGLAEPDSGRVFARTVNSVASRIGCPAVAPRTESPST